MKPIKQNHDAWINIAPKIVETNYLKTNDMLILFYPTFNFGYFKKYIPPTLILFREDPPNYIKQIKGRKIFLEDLIKKENYLEIKFSKSNNNIYKIRLIDFPNEINTTT